MRQLRAFTPLFPVLLALAALSLSGCLGGTSPVTNFYSLEALLVSPVGAGAEPAKGSTVSLELLAFPEYLDRPQIATRSEPSRIEYAELHQWAGSLETELPLVLARNLQAACPSMAFAQTPWPPYFEPDYRLYLEIFRFDGTLGREAVLAVHWVIAKTGTQLPLIERRSMIVEKASGPGFQGVVAAQNRTLQRLAEEIAAVLRSL